MPVAHASPDCTATGSTRPREIRVCAFPHSSGPNRYLDQFYKALVPYGVRTVVDGVMENSFLRAHHHEFDVFHIHWTHEVLWRRSGGTVARLRGLAGAVRFIRLLHRLGKRLVWTVHDLEPLDGGGWADRAGNTLLARSSDLVICHADETRERILGTYRGRRDRTVVMHHGNYDGVFPQAKPRAETLAALGLDPARRTLVAIGVIRGYKGFDVAVRAMETLGPEYQLIVAGRVYAEEPDVPRDLERLAAGRSAVQLCLRTLSDADIADLYAAADCVLLPYVRITGSGALLAAVSAGRGVVVTRLPFFCEMLAREPGAGVIVPVNNPAGLADGVRSFFAGGAASRHVAARRLADQLAWPEVVMPVAERFGALFTSTDGGRP